MILEVCERTVVLDAGRVAADGRSEEILRDRALLESHGLELPLGVARE
jgi:cobalt/nickel transport system ATP-binding protein